MISATVQSADKLIFLSGYAGGWSGVGLKAGGLQGCRCGMQAGKATPRWPLGLCQAHGHHPLAQPAHPHPHPPPVCLAHSRCSEVLALRLEHLNLSLCCVEVRSCPIHLGSSELGSGPGTFSAPITWGGKECAVCAKSESRVRASVKGRGDELT